MQAHFLHKLMAELNMFPAILWGQSSGARMSIFFASMFPDQVHGLVLINITGGSKAATNLAQAYHGRHADACRRGGMDLVMKQELFSAMISKRPANEDLLRSMKPEDFIKAQECWASFLRARNGDPIVGASSEDLASVKQPAFCVNNYGSKNDGMHTPAAIRALADGLHDCVGCIVETKASVWQAQAFAFIQSLVAQQDGQAPQGKHGFDGSVVVETETMVLFWQRPAVFSQWTRSEFVVDGVHYDCCEMFMMAEKARLFGDEETRQLILAARGNPKRMLSLGRQVRGFDQAVWDQQCMAIVTAGNLAKFEQNLDMRAQLLATADKTLVEASPSDANWGIGLRADHPDTRDPSRWRGTNMLGEALMAVRSVLREQACGQGPEVPGTGQEPHAEAGPRADSIQSTAGEEEAPAAASGLGVVQ
mmetsp:Transcript_32309/g.65505  ORF Transcript_32309/g.65505 Transcript_32309/m.65505 type:complete len:421 (-) Transcript_32309:44-1306(-)